MKKFLLSLAVMLGCISFASAETISFTMDQVSLDQVDVDKSNNPVINGFSYGVIDATIDSGENTGTKIIYSNSGKDVRVYANQILTISTTDGSNMTEIVFTISDNGKKRLADMSVNTGSCVSNGADAWTVVWTGNASSVSFTVGASTTVGTESGKAGRLAFKAMNITTDGEGGGVVVEKSATPVISPESQTFSEAVAVTISAAEGATIYYTLDGTTPTEASDVYAGAPIAVVSTTTVKAMAIEEGKTPSDVAAETYTKVAGDFAMSSVLGDAAVGQTLEVGGIVTGISTRGFVVTDNTGSLFFYVANGFDVNAYAIGDQVTFSGEVSEYGFGLQFAGAEIVVTKWGNAGYTYPAPTVLDGAACDAIASRSASENASYVSLKGTVVVNGNYINMNIAGAQKSQGSVYYATEEVKAKLQNGLEADIKGYLVSVSSGKYVNILVTEVATSGNVDPVDENEVANIAEFIKKGLNDAETVFTITGEVAVTYHNGQNLYVQDATGSLLVYDGGSFGTDFRNGERLKGIKGTFKDYFSTYEMVADPSSFNPTSGEAVAPTVYTIENIVPEIQNAYVAIENVTFDSANSRLIDAIDAEIKIYNKFKMELPADGEYTVIGLVSYYTAKGATEPELQIYPVEFAEAGIVVPPTNKNEAATFAQALALGAEGVTDAITFTGNATVVYHNNRNLYVKDAETWTMLYCKDVEMPKYENGDVITGFQMTYGTNDGQPQFLPVAGTFSEGTPGTEVEPVVITASEVNAANYHKYVVLVNAAFANSSTNKTGYATDATGTATIYATWDNQYSDPQVGFPADGNYDIKGFISSYNGNFQILAAEFAEANAIENIDADNAPAEYFNLQGVKVSNPENGLYIRRQGNNVEKVFIK